MRVTVFVPPTPIKPPESLIGLGTEEAIKFMACKDAGQHERSYVAHKCLGVSTETDTNIAQKQALAQKEKDSFHQLRDTRRE
ncbi:hypothetical protein MTR67_031421 [Solanum verrucosum]|uniref:Uncharacterized protein n=1 Tax=Solanum verrucosum TaxID=315347 RepID=A0AAF0U2I2_SOLVR|nr:hypothetical protein MTR67_031421 [Solanum verrucosum]